MTSEGIRRPARPSTRTAIRGLGVGLLVATGLSAWATFLRVWQGVAPFDRLSTPYARTVAVYYVGFGVGGAMLGALLPLRRWALGSMLLGVLFVAPVYAGFVFLHPPTTGLSLSWKILGTLAASVIVGGGLGLWVWSNEQRGRD
jgi:FtsH-binding integral membrane protein